MSVGAAVYDSMIHDAIDAVLNAADNALYQAKGKGRNNVQISDQSERATFSAPFA